MKIAFIVMAISLTCGQVFAHTNLSCQTEDGSLRASIFIINKNQTRRIVTATDIGHGKLMAVGSDQIPMQLSEGRCSVDESELEGFDGARLVCFLKGSEGQIFGSHILVWRGEDNLDVLTPGSAPTKMKCSKEIN